MLLVVDKLFNTLSKEKEVYVCVLEVAFDLLVVSFSARGNSNAKVPILPGKAVNKLMTQRQVSLNDIKDYSFLVVKLFKNLNLSLVKLFLGQGIANMLLELKESYRIVGNLWRKVGEGSY